MVKEETHLQFELVSKEVMDKYRSAKEKIRKELAQIFLDDNIWYLKCWDANGVGIVKIHCSECMKDLSGNSDEYNNYTISNLFANFKKHHLHTNTHNRSLYWRQGLPYTDHPQSAALKGKFV